MFVIKDLLKVTDVFESTIWADVIQTIRDVIDVKVNSEYVTNIVDDVLACDFGSWELSPDLIDAETSSGQLIPDLYELQKKVDTVIGINKQYWIQYIDSIVKAREFDPLYNVDGYETYIRTYGQHITDKNIGARSRTDTYAPTQRTLQHGQQKSTSQYGETSKTITEGGRQDTNQFGQKITTNGQQVDTNQYGGTTVSHSETTMDNTVASPLKTQDSSISHTDTLTKGSHDITEGIHTDTITKGQQQNTETDDPHTDTTTLNQYSDIESTIQVQNTSADIATKDTETSREHTDRETVRRYGNIGVTKSTDLLESNIEFGKRLRIVPIIANEIAKKISVAAIWY